MKNTVLSMHPINTAISASSFPVTETTEDYRHWVNLGKRTSAVNNVIEGISDIASQYQKQHQALANLEELLNPSKDKNTQLFWPKAVSMPSDKQQIFSFSTGTLLSTILGWQAGSIQSVQNIYIDHVFSTVNAYLSYQVNQNISKSTLTPTQEMISGIPFIPTEVYVYCIDNGLVHAVFGVIDLIKKFFKVTKLEFEIQHDDASDDKWVLITIATSGSIDELLGKYNDLTGAISSNRPFIQHNLIRISLDIDD